MNNFFIPNNIGLINNGKHKDIPWFNSVLQTLLSCPHINKWFIINFPDNYHKYNKFSNYFYILICIFFNLYECINKVKKYLEDTYEHSIHIENVCGTTNFNLILIELYKEYIHSPFIEFIDGLFSIIDLMNITHLRTFFLFQYYNISICSHCNMQSCYFTKFYYKKISGSIESETYIEEQLCKFCNQISYYNTISNMINSPPPIIIVYIDNPVEILNIGGIVYYLVAQIETNYKLTYSHLNSEQNTQFSMEYTKTINQTTNLCLNSSETRNSPQDSLQNSLQNSPQDLPQKKIHWWIKGRRIRGQYKLLNDTSISTTTIGKNPFIYYTVYHRIFKK